MQGMTIMFFVMLLSLGVAALWDSLPPVKVAIHSILDPSAGALFGINPVLGMAILTLIIMLISTLLQKYATDQDTLKQIKEEQKIVQQEMKLAKEHPEKSMELSKKSLELTMKAMPLTMRPLIYTIIPFVLIIRWLGDYFSANPAKIVGMSWFWAYIVFSMVFSIILRKVFKVH